MNSLQFEVLNTSEELLSTQDSEMLREEFFKTKQARKMRQCMSEYTKKTTKAIRRYQQACKSREEMRSFRLSVDQVKQSMVNFHLFQINKYENSTRNDELSTLKKEVQEIKDRFYRYKYAAALAETENQTLKDKIAKMSSKQNEDALCRCQIF